MDIKNIYTQLTTVDIEQQKRIWDERGKGYYGEYLLFCELYSSIHGNGKILMNLNVPVNDYKTTEIDLILIHETGLYVFEIKHYKGTIYGKNDDKTWTQYFRTVKNNVFRNPFEQNMYHIDALNKLFPEIPLYSCIVFTNPDCEIRVDNSYGQSDVCALRDIKRTLENRFSTRENKYSMTDIDDIFSKLSAYSQMKEPITLEGIESDFSSWVEPTISKLKEKISETEIIKSNWIVNTNKLKKTKTKMIIGCIIFIVICVITSFLICNFAIQKNNNKLAELKQNFLHVDEIDNVYIDKLNSYVEVSNVSLLPLTEDAVSFTARITITNDIYGIMLTEDSKYIVMTNSGKVMEYNVFGDHLKYNQIENMIGIGHNTYGDLANAQFYGINNIDDISYIKITCIKLFKLDITRTEIKDNLEIELYSK